jgi:hypothetical protein
LTTRPDCDIMLSTYHLNELEGGGFAGGKATRETPIFPHLLKRYLSIVSR